MKSTKTKKITKINDKTVIATLDIGKTVQYGYFITGDVLKYLNNSEKEKRKNRTRDVC